MGQRQGVRRIGQHRNLARTARERHDGVSARRRQHRVLSRQHMANGKRQGAQRLTQIQARQPIQLGAQCGTVRRGLLRMGLQPFQVLPQFAAGTAFQFQAGEAAQRAGRVVRAGADRVEEWPRNPRRPIGRGQELGEAATVTTPDSIRGAARAAAARASMPPRDQPTQIAPAGADLSSSSMTLSRSSSLAGDSPQPGRSTA
jgi:hypothetical protein